MGAWLQRSQTAAREQGITIEASEWSASQKTGELDRIKKLQKKILDRVIQLTAKSLIPTELTLWAIQQPGGKAAYITWLQGHQKQLRLELFLLKQEWVRLERKRLSAEYTLQASLHSDRLPDP